VTAKSQLIPKTATRCLDDALHKAFDSIITNKDLSELSSNWAAGQELTTLAVLWPIVQLTIQILLPIVRNFHYLKWYFN